MKLLIVDDQHSVYLYIEKVLNIKAIGFDHSFYASNGEEALPIIETEKPEVMLLDIQMPKMNGIQLLEALSERNIPIPLTIVLSAYDEFSYAQRCIDFGINSYVLKPIDPDEIFKQLTNAVKKLSDSSNVRLEALFPMQCVTENDALPSAPCKPFRVVCVKAGTQFLEKTIAHHRTRGIDFYLLSVEDPKNCSQDIFDNVTDLPKAIRAAETALWLHFYESIPEGNPKDNPLLNLEENFYSEDAKSLFQEVEKAFMCFRRDNIPPQTVLAECEKVYCQLAKRFNGEKVTLFDDAYIDAADALQRFMEQLYILKDAADPVFSHSATETVYAIKDYIDTHFDEDLSLSVMSSRFYISRYQISRLFKQIFGTGYKEYILSIRMNAAAQMLQKTDARLYEISLAVGFDEQSYFSNVFKKTFGVNPQTYRLKERIKDDE